MLSKGSPSHLAELGLLDDVPPGYWEQWSAETAARIRQQAQNVRCNCAREQPHVVENERCKPCGAKASPVTQSSTTDIDQGGSDFQQPQAAYRVHIKRERHDGTTYWRTHEVAAFSDEGLPLVALEGSYSGLGRPPAATSPRRSRACARRAETNMRTSARAREITSGMAGPPQVVCGSGPCGPLTTAIVRLARDTTREDQPHASILTKHRATLLAACRPRGKLFQGELIGRSLAITHVLVVLARDPRNDARAVAGATGIDIDRVGQSYATLKRQASSAGSVGGTDFTFINREMALHHAVEGHHAVGRLLDAVESSADALRDRIVDKG